MKSFLTFTFLLIALGVTVVLLPPDIRRWVFTRRNAAILAAVIASLTLLFTVAVMQTGVSFQLF